MTRDEMMARTLQLIGFGDIDNADDYILDLADDMTQDEANRILAAIDGIDHNDMMQLLDTLRDNNYNDLQIP